MALFSTKPASLKAYCRTAGGFAFVMNAIFSLIIAMQGVGHSET